MGKCQHWVKNISAECKIHDAGRSKNDALSGHEGSGGAFFLGFLCLIANKDADTAHGSEKRDFAERSFSTGVGQTEVA